MQSPGPSKADHFKRPLPAAAATMCHAVTREEQEAAAAKGRMGQAAKRLFMAKRAERMLASYQREGWLEDQPSRATGRNEIRPAAEMGPIIVCLDTSYSMAGKRETVAKVWPPTCCSSLLLLWGAKERAACCSSEQVVKLCMSQGVTGGRNTLYGNSSSNWCVHMVLQNPRLIRLPWTLHLSGLVMIPHSAQGSQASMGSMMPQTGWQLTGSGSTPLPLPETASTRARPAMQAVALECMRGAHRQGRACYLYAFSGPQQCQELALDHSPGSMAALLNFLSFSFLGGTDVDTPFLRALDRLTDAAWRLSDILLVKPQSWNAYEGLPLSARVQRGPLHGFTGLMLVVCADAWCCLVPVGHSPMRRHKPSGEA